MNAVGLALMGYAIGSIPFSFLVARLFGVKDVRAVGSGNVGATNVMRSAGKFPGALALVLDGLKGAATVWLARSFTTVRIRIDNGEVLDIDTPVLLGRNPGQLPGFESARLIPVADLARSISKTHLAVGPDGAGVWVEDLNSMNGVRVTVPGGAPTKAIVGQRYPVPPGGRVEFGDRSFVVVAG